MRELGKSLRAGFAPIAVLAGVRARHRKVSAVTILGYHDVLPTIEERYHITLSAFSHQMERLSRPPFDVLTLDDALDSERSDDDTRCRVVITFDDARDNFLKYALPILEEYRLPCTLYAPTRLIGTPGFMDAAELMEVAERGVEIGTHGRSHLDLNDMPPEAAEDEIRGSRSDLEHILDRRVRHFSYPFGGWNPRVREALIDSGYHSAVTTRPGHSTHDTDRYTLHRSWPDASMTVRWFEVMVLGGDDIFRWNALRKTLRIASWPREKASA